MFTGLIIEMGEIVSVKMRSGGAVLSLKAQEAASAAKLGDSISVNGVCLTVTELRTPSSRLGSPRRVRLSADESPMETELSFDLSDETLRSTNLGRLKRGDRVNLEASLSPASKIGGHFVTGHVDAVGTIRSKADIGDMLKIEISAPAKVMNFIVEKGSVAVDGISLTVVDVLNDGFTVVIIPHTAKLTTVGFKGAGDTVNIEADILGKYVAKFLNKDKGKDSLLGESPGATGLMNTLMSEGYIK